MRRYERTKKLAASHSASAFAIQNAPAATQPIAKPNTAYSLAFRRLRLARLSVRCISFQALSAVSIFANSATCTRVYWGKNDARSLCCRISVRLWPFSGPSTTTTSKKRKTSPTMRWCSTTKLRASSFVPAASKSQSRSRPTLPAP